MEKHITLPRESAIDRTVLMEGKDNAGHSVAVNRSYFLKDGKPWLPVMGEIHYARLEESDWKRALAKMKAGGIDIVATYVFWIYHEEVEGRFDWTGRRNLRHFIELCEEAGLAVLLRIGPWDHGEVRNGGYPDWLLAKDCNPGYNNEEYFSYAKKLYDEIFAQVEGFLYKDGGPIIGVQIDNEYGHCHGQGGEEGLKHMRRLKEMAVAAGFDVPMYTATGWGGAVVVPGEMIPVLAAYAEGSWEQHLNPMAPPASYLFADERDDIAVGSDLASDEIKKCTVDLRAYPYATCEIGGGMQDSYRRRPVVTADDTECLMLAKFGSGANMIGYYMYQSGTNDTGKLTDLQETEATGYPNNLPKRSYDYQAPLGEFGEMRASFRYLRLYHMLCHDFGDVLTETTTVIPDEGQLRADDPDALRVSVRHKDGRGFVFLSNYQRGLQMAAKNDVHLTLTYGERDIAFPAFTLGSGERLVLPFGLRIGSIEIAAATAQPLCRIDNGDDSYWFFFAYEGRKVAYDFRQETVRGIDAEQGEVMKQGGRVVVTPGASAFAVLGMDGRRHHIVTLTRREAERCLKITVGGQDYLVSSDADLFVEDGRLVLHGEAGTDPTVTSFPELPRHLFAWSAAMSFFAIWLGQHLGIGATKVGILYSANAIVALILQPVFGFVSDKIGLRKTLMFFILAVLMLIGPFFIFIYGPLLVSHFYIGAAVGGVFLGFVFNAGYGVIDSYIDKVSRKYGFEYGRARMWGSFGWACATYTTGIFMNIDPDLSFLSASAAAILAICFLAFADVDMTKEEMKKAQSVHPRDVLALLKNKSILHMLFFMIGVGCVYDVYDQQFGVYFVQQFASEAEGNLWFGRLGAIQTFFEAVFLFGAPVIANKLGGKRTLLLAGTIMSIRIIGSSFQWGPEWIGFMKCIHSFEKPLFLVGQFKYISQVFDVRLCSSIYLGCLFTSSICTTVFSSFFGFFYETFGFSESYLVIGLVAGLCNLISARLLADDRAKKAGGMGEAAAITGQTQAEAKSV